MSHQQIDVFLTESLLKIQSTTQAPDLMKGRPFFFGHPLKYRQAVSDLLKMLLQEIPADLTMMFLTCKRNPPIRQPVQNERTVRRLDLTGSFNHHSQRMADLNAKERPVTILFSSGLNNFQTASSVSSYLTVTAWQALQHVVRFL